MGLGPAGYQAGPTAPSTNLPWVPETLATPHSPLTRSPLPTISPTPLPPSRSGSGLNPDCPRRRVGHDAVAGPPPCRRPSLVGRLAFLPEDRHCPLAPPRLRRSRSPDPSAFATSSASPPRLSIAGHPELPRARCPVPYVPLVSAPLFPLFPVTGSGPRSRLPASPARPRAVPLRPWPHLPARCACRPHPGHALRC